MQYTVHWIVIMEQMLDINYRTDAGYYLEDMLDIIYRTDDGYLL